MLLHSKPNEKVFETYKSLDQREFETGTFVRIFQSFWIVTTDFFAFTHSISHISTILYPRFLDRRMTRRRQY